LLASTGHWMDIGGSVPGGWAPKATEIHQEGLISNKALRGRQAERATREDVHRQCPPAGPDCG
jgi:N-methylhydantoinase B/oxoprolinase/acetone carboxylase alpha subunit